MRAMWLDDGGSRKEQRRLSQRDRQGLNHGAPEGRDKVLLILWVIGTHWTTSDMGKKLYKLHFWKKSLSFATFNYFWALNIYTCPHMYYSIPYVHPLLFCLQHFPYLICLPFLHFPNLFPPAGISISRNVSMCCSNSFSLFKGLVPFTVISPPVSSSLQVSYTALLLSLLLYWSFSIFCTGYLCQWFCPSPYFSCPLSYWSPVHCHYQKLQFLHSLNLFI